MMLSNGSNLSQKVDDIEKQKSGLGGIQRADRRNNRMVVVAHS